MQERIKTHCVHTPLASLEEAANHRLMALICEDTEAHEHLVLSIMAMIANAQENEVAAIDVSIGNIYFSDAIGKCAPTFCTVSSWQTTDFSS